MKNKFLITAMFFSSITYPVFAQFENEQQYKWSIAAAINSVEAQMDQKLFDTWIFPSANYYAYFGDKHDKSISLSIIPKYQIADDIFLRFEFGITNINLSSHYDGTNNYITPGFGFSSAANITKDVTIRQKIYRYVPGIQWRFMKKKFMESYCGASLNYFHYAKMNWTDYVADNTSPNLSNYSRWTSTTPGGFASGIGAFMGFNIHLPKNISLGGEFFYSLLYYELGGIQKGVYVRGYPVSPTAPPGYTETAEFSLVGNTSKGIQFSKVMPSFNISIRF